MDKIIDRKDIKDEFYRNFLDKEKHHDHKIYIDCFGTYRWVQDSEIKKMAINIDFNDLITSLYDMGLDKNSEIYRKLYRCLGYSLRGYWEVFYWEWNNENASEYTGKQLEEINPDKCRKYIDIIERLALE